MNKLEFRMDIHTVTREYTPQVNSLRVSHQPSPLSLIQFSSVAQSCLSHLFLLLFLLPWQTDLRKHYYSLSQRMFCLCSLLGI